ncbi:hypothetical protein [Spiroplasma clarkii]|uniref:hypothetical protein n=1 Tax=Spiroplasma clarkii TaxID=2139 RepID=UPI001C998A50|nr:hypothetical protein [Spiroplasma clarkii]
MVTNVDEIIGFGSIFELLNEKIAQLNIKKIVFEADWVYVNEAAIFTKKLNAEMQAYNFATVRMIKDEWEVAQIKKLVILPIKFF